jgi:hypothetical protein
MELILTMMKKMKKGSRKEAYANFESQLLCRCFMPLISTQSRHHKDHFRGKAPEAQYKGCQRFL